MKSFLLVLLTIKCIAGIARANPVVTTPKGQIRGLQAEDGDYDMYLGIPYAVVDEDNPFGPSTPHPNFEDIFDAFNDGVACIQVYNSSVTGVMQCLQLNVYVPQTASPTNTLPVMVFIHGGSFLLGHKAELSPRFLLRHDIIVVTLNYRLGLYGFLCTSEPGLKNVGLKDQVLAFKWVKDNIAAFGGNTDQVTISGMSAGAMSVDIHMLAGQNLGQKAILMSGTAMTTWIISEEDDEMPISLARVLGFSGNDINGAIQFLGAVDPSVALATADSLHYLSQPDGHSLTFPCVESASDSAILTDYPVNLQPKVKGMDIMIGYTNKEVMFIYPNADNVQFYRNFSFDDELLFEFDEAHGVDTVRQFYIGDEQPNENLQDAILDYASDFSFVHSAERSVDKYLDAEANSIYKYLFSYEGDRNFVKIMLNLTASGASHGDDMGYVFDIPVFQNVPITEADQRVIDAMTKMWTDFVKYGNPTPEPTDLVPEWKPVDKERRPYLNIDNTIKAESRVFHKRMAFWDLYYKIHGHKVRGYEVGGGNEEDDNEEGGDGAEDNEEGGDGAEDNEEGGNGAEDNEEGGEGAEDNEEGGDGAEDNEEGGNGAEDNEEGGDEEGGNGCNSVVSFKLLSIFTLFVTLFR